VVNALKGKQKMDIVIDGRTINVKLPDLRKGPQVTAHGTDFAAMVEEQNKIKSEIMEKGFGQYISDMQQEKLEEEIREKILAALGLTEEQFKQLPAEQRAAIEESIQAGIRAEMEARMGQENAENKKDKSGVSMPLVAGLSM